MKTLDDKVMYAHVHMSIKSKFTGATEYSCLDLVGA